MLTGTPRPLRYNLHDLLRVRLDVAPYGGWASRLLDSKLHAFGTNGNGPEAADVVMHIGPFEPEVPRGATIVDKDFHCAPDYIFYRGHRGAGATEIRGLAGPTTEIRYAPNSWAPLGWLGSALRGINMYLEPVLKQRLLGLDPPVWLMHGGAVARDGEALALFGSNGTFKTRLILDLCLRHGFDFLGDDLILLRDGEALCFVEHPAVLAARAEAVRAGRPPSVGRWRLASNVLRNGRSTSSPPKTAQRARIAALVALERGSALEETSVECDPVADVWQRAVALDRYELSKHQRRYRQVTNFSRFAMAYEYAFPDSRLFALACGPAPPVPDWLLRARAAICRVPSEYDRRAAERLAALWQTEGVPS